MNGGTLRNQILGTIEILSDCDPHTITLIPPAYLHRNLDREGNILSETLVLSDNRAAIITNVGTLPTP